MEPLCCSGLVNKTDNPYVEVPSPTVLKKGVNPFKRLVFDCGEANCDEAESGKELLLKKRRTGEFLEVEVKTTAAANEVLINHFEHYEKIKAILPSIRDGSLVEHQIKSVLNVIQLLFQHPKFPCSIREEKDRRLYLTFSSYFISSLSSSLLKKLFTVLKLFPIINLQQIGSTHAKNLSVLKDLLLQITDLELNYPENKEYDFNSHKMIPLKQELIPYEILSEVFPKLKSLIMNYHPLVNIHSLMKLLQNHQFESLDITGCQLVRTFHFSNNQSFYCTFRFAELELCGFQSLFPTKSIEADFIGVKGNLEEFCGVDLPECYPWIKKPKNFIDEVFSFESNEEDIETLTTHIGQHQLYFMNQELNNKCKNLFSYAEAESSLYSSFNRYPNVIPHDYCNLTQELGFYLNASPLTGLDGRRYIAAQGPLGIDEEDEETQATVADFWHGVLALNSSLIVMLTNFIEKGKVKCSPYWPYTIGMKATYISRQNPDYQVSVTWVQEDKVAEGIYERTFMLEEASATHPSFVKQLHAADWLDHTALNPDQLNKLIELIKVRESKNPTVFHCSAGLGRTGLTILCLFIDKALDLLIAKNPKAPFDQLQFNIKNALMFLRYHRKGMIQSLDQISAALYYFRNALKDKISKRIS